MYTLKHLKSFTHLFESFEDSPVGFPEISITEFLNNIGIRHDKATEVADWWNKNRGHIKIYFFPFKCAQPIAGIFLENDTICVNENFRMAPPHVRLFLALHESRHCDQYAEGIFMDGYYNTVLQNDKNGFIRSYEQLERDCNDFAIDSMREMGFIEEMNREERILRSNERAGAMVYDMMKNDIEKFDPVDMFDLLKKQIL